MQAREPSPRITHRAALLACVLLGPACPAGPDTTTTATSSASTGATESAGTSTVGATDASSGALPTGSGDATGATSTAGPGTTGDATSTGDTTDATTSDATTTDATTGSQRCDAIVGATDCAALVAVSGDLTLEQCMTCQGAPCGMEPACDGQFPCVDGSIVIQGCCTDEQCAGLAPYCGMFIAPDNVCVLSDDV